MDNKGFTLIEVILAIFIIGLLAASFLPMITFGYKGIIDSKKFTEALFKDQELLEEKIEELRDKEPVNPNMATINVYGKEIKGHKISINTTSSGVVNMFLPKKRVVAPIPVIQSPPNVIVRNSSDIAITPKPSYIDLLDSDKKLFVDEPTITTATKDNYLMSVYRWYMSSEIDSSNTPPTTVNEYLVLKEWNEAKKQLSFAESVELKFIPNIKETYNKDKNIKEYYNNLTFEKVRDALSFNNESFINTLGNRYIRYGITPFSVAGRIGKEELSDPIYIKAPRIEIEKAEFADINKIYIYFKEDIGEAIDQANIRINETLGNPKFVYRDSTNNKLLILEFDNLDNTKEINSNKLTRGAVSSKTYGKISIWYNNTPEGEFKITSP